MKIGIFGIGIWSAIGQDHETVSENLLEARCGIGRSEERRAYGYQSDLTGIVPMPSAEEVRGTLEEIKAWRVADGADGERIMTGQQMRCMGEPARYALMAVWQAVRDAGLSAREVSEAALVVSNDSTAGALAEVEDVMREWHDTRRIGAYKVFQTQNSTVSMTLSQVLGIGGLSLTVSGACAGGGHAIGLATEWIRSGRVKRAIVVGAQEVGVHAYTSFDALGVFSRTGSKPFAKDRDGLVPSGGAAAVVLSSDESLDTGAGGDYQPSTINHKPRTGRMPWGWVLGYGFSTSADIVSPKKESIRASMEMALTDAERNCMGQMIPAWAIGLWAAHATGTQEGDLAEGLAIKEMLEDSRRGWEHDREARRADNFVVSTKALTGHECWMSGVSQVVYTLLQLGYGFVAGHPSLGVMDERLRGLCVPTVGFVPERDVMMAMCNSFGFGGTNASLVIRRG